MSLDPLPPSGAAVLTAASELREAAGRDEARAAAAALTRLAVGNAGAVTALAGEVVASVRFVVEDGCPWRADAFATYLHVLEHAHVWADRRAGADAYQGEYEDGITWENTVVAATAGFDGPVRNLIVDPDPEGRSLACLLLGWISTAPELDFELLRMLRAQESDELVRACAGEASLRVAGAGLTAEALALLEDPSAVVRQRIARFFVPSRHAPAPEGVDPAVSTRARAVLSERRPDRTLSLRWPAEEQ